MEKNIQGIEKMGPMGILETSRRVRESLAWTRQKRLGAIKGEKVSPEAIVDGSYAKNYAQPVEQPFEEILVDDVVGFRDKMLQFLANPDALVADFMPTVE